ncbi:MAG TPA: NifB/NifX family molybdenum-iron cluster-binding protein [Terracidiphilus sp.]|nr:NifB/NifX family molybdenum-iron cluster-binding protein [Terracidiphilus sp.]
MKIAVATADGSTVSQHFGQSRGFIVFTVEEGRITGRELKSAADTPHNEGVCSGQAQQGGGVAALLEGCEALLCGGMGGGAATAIVQLGIKPMVLAGVPDAEEAVRMFCDGRASEKQAGYCNCQH